jgi:hypothetical protein
MVKRLLVRVHRREVPHVPEKEPEGEISDVVVVERPSYIDMERATVLEDDKSPPSSALSSPDAENLVDVSPKYGRKNPRPSDIGVKRPKFSILLCL